MYVYKGDYEKASSIGDESLMLAKEEMARKAQSLLNLRFFFIKSTSTLRIKVFSLFLSNFCKFAFLPLVFIQIQTFQKGIDSVQFYFFLIVSTHLIGAFILRTCLKNH